MSIKHLEFDNTGRLGYSSTSGSYVDLLVMSDDADFLFIQNATDATFYFKIPVKNGTKELILSRFTDIAIDCRINSKRLAKGTIQVKRLGTPTTGELLATVIR